MKPSFSIMSMSPRRSLKTVNGIADSLGSDRRTVARSIEKAGITPRGHRGRWALYSTRAVERALRQYQAERFTPGPARLELLRQQVRKLKIANDRTEATLVPRTLLLRHLKRFFPAQRAILEKHLLDRFPESAAGRDPASVRVLGKASVDAICRDHQTEIAGWTI